MKITIKKECPYCLSKNISSLGYGHYITNSSEAISKAKMKYKCNSCKEEFYIVE